MPRPRLEPRRRARYGVGHEPGIRTGRRPRFTRCNGGRSAGPSPPLMAAVGGAAALARRPALGRPARPYGPLRVQLDLATSPDLQQYYRFHWQLIGNLGVDLLVDAAGAADRARAGGQADRDADPAADRRRHALGRARGARPDCRRPRCSRCRSPTAIPFLFGFVNFALVDGAGLARLRLVAAARRGSASRGCARSCSCRSRCILWFAHAFGWGTLGRALLSRPSWSASTTGAAARRSAGLRAALPLPVAGAAGRADAAVAQRAPAGMTDRLVQLGLQAGEWLRMALRDRWELFDIASLGARRLRLIAVRAGPAGG